MTIDRNEQSERGGMSAERWRVLEPLFDDALDEAPEHRHSFLKDACGDDTALLDELLTLLQTGEAADAELDDGVGALVPELLREVTPRALDIPDVLAGRYRIVRELGQGGMSVVFLADDLRHARQVAIKVFRRDSRFHRADERFLAEIKLTASLRHPNIVPLFDSGDADGWTFFVMPYIEGETLLARLARDSVPDMERALRIVSDIAGALSYAHRAGVIHRDVKPSNIMLTDDQALLVDFGIARIGRGQESRFTLSGSAVGTPAYMSPEQCVGDGDVGPTSDIYSLAGVLHELLTGRPPESAVLRLAKVAPGAAAREVQVDRNAGIPPALAAVIARAMHLDPAARYATAAEFAEALLVAVTDRGGRTLLSVRDGGGRTPVSVVEQPFDARVSRAKRGDRTTWVVAGVAALALISAVYASRGGSGEPGTGVSAAIAGQASGDDTSRIVLLPLEYDPAVRQRIGSHDPMRDALLRWTGVTLVDAAETREALAALHPSASALSAREASRVANAVGAGRYLRSDLTMSGTQVYLHAALFDAGSDRLRSHATVNLGASLDTSETGYRDVADQILLPGVPSGLRAGALVGTRSRAALQQFARGVSAVDRWDLAVADSALDMATVYDSAFASAEIWLAQVRVWRQRPDEAWSYLVNRAQVRRAALAPRDQQALDALTAQAHGDTRAACHLWQRFAATAVTDFSAWYGAASCEREDNAVLRDARSPSGWRFRGSYSHAAAMYSRAFQILPAVHREFRGSWFSGMDDVLFTSPTQMRLGFAMSPDTGVFAAYPSWDAAGDTLTFVPYRLRDINLSRRETYPASHRDAVRHQREAMRRVATTWRAVFPANADAMLAVAVSLDKLGDASALDSLRIARTLATNVDERLRIAIAEVWLTVKYAVPEDIATLRATRVMADSLLKANPNPAPAMGEALASVAMLVGRASLAATLANSGYETVDIVTPPPLKRLATRLQILAAAGAPPDTLARLEAAVIADITRTVSREHQNEVRDRLIGRVATLAFPGYHSAMLSVVARSRELAQAQASFVLGDTAAMRRMLVTMGETRRAVPPEFLKLETLLPEAELLLAAGDVTGAVQRIAPTLDVQSVSELEWIKTPIGAAILVRSMALRAVLAARAGDRIASNRWARAFMALWWDAEPMLRPQVVRVAGIVG